MKFICTPWFNNVADQDAERMNVSISLYHTHTPTPSESWSVNKTDEQRDQQRAEEINVDNRLYHTDGRGSHATMPYRPFACIIEN